MALHERCNVQSHFHVIMFQVMARLPMITKILHCCQLEKSPRLELDAMLTTAKTGLDRSLANSLNQTVSQEPNGATRPHSSLLAHPSVFSLRPKESMQKYYGHMVVGI
jgi:hypothetical protein